MTGHVVNKGTTKYTQVIADDKLSYNCSPNFAVMRMRDRVLLADIHFQDGPVNEVGINGVANEDLIVMVLHRLEQFQDSPFKCEENASAIKNLNAALRDLHRRTNGRAKRGVEGTSEV